MDLTPLVASLRERIRQLVTVNKMQACYDRILAEFKTGLDIKVDNAMAPEIAAGWAKSVEQSKPGMNPPPMQQAPDSSGCALQAGFQQDEQASERHGRIKSKAQNTIQMK